MRERLQTNQLEAVLPYLWAIAYNLLGNTHDAEDAVQEVVCKFLTKQPQLVSSEKWQSYLGKMLSNHCCDILRRSKKMLSLDTLPDNVVADVEDAGDFQEDGDKELARWLARLSPKDRLVLDLFYREHLPVEKIAQCLGDSTGAVKVRLHRARQSLKNIAAKEGCNCGRI